MKKLAKIILKGITWDHSRGYTPLVATAQRFMELHSDIDIIWHKRSLQEFADKPIARLAEEYDLMIIDYPWIGYGAETGQFLPLNNYLPEKFLQQQLDGTVGASYESYTHQGQLYAIPMDAAAPVASYRPDLFQANNRKLPKTFDDVLELASRGQVILPGIAIDTLMNFYMFCCSLGESPFQNKEAVVSTSTGVRALALYKSLIDLVDPICFQLNPIKTYELLSTQNRYCYCPFAYGYTNYARPGFSSHVLHFTDLVALGEQPLISTIGGTGLAVSSSCNYKSIALDYLSFTTSPDTQAHLYFEAGGQPAHKKAWLSRPNNAATHKYFDKTLPTLERSYLRPRYNGYIHFQDNAGEIIRNYLMNDGDPATVLSQLNHLLNHAS